MFHGLRCPFDQPELLIIPCEAYIAVVPSMTYAPQQMLWLPERADLIRVICKGSQSRLQFPALHDRS